MKTNRKMPVVNIQGLTSRSKAMNTVSKEAKLLPSLIIWDPEELKDNDPAKRHAHALQLVESVIRNVLPEEVSGVYNIKVIRLGVNMSHHFALSSTNNLGSHSESVHKRQSNKLKLVFGYSHRVVNDWNAFPEYVIHFQGKAGPSLEDKLSGLTQVNQPTIHITDD
ncbi:unnamed protein product [Schistosoma mattheei]|uniref:Uncharacterized protein n=1 Tax=Schistosoma mattheei TaxID=31246 RepID=A0A183NK84_9TREM|nr:unnamed protein product [Schistosoma mattheei]